MAYRTEQRTPFRLTALVWGSDEAGHMFMETVQTLDISPMGARLRKLQHPVQVGSILGIQNGDEQDFELDRRRSLLEAFGYAVYTASSAQQAFDLLNVVHVEAVMLDQPFP